MRTFNHVTLLGLVAQAPAAFGTVVQGARFFVTTEFFQKNPERTTYTHHEVVCFDRIARHALGRLKPGMNVFVTGALVETQGRVQVKATFLTLLGYGQGDDPPAEIEIPRLEDPAKDPPPRLAGDPGE